MNTTLADAKHELDRLIEARADLEKRLELAIQEPNANAMIRLRRELAENSIRQYAQRAKILRLEKTVSTRDREEALTLKDELEEQLREATKQYSDAVAVADEMRIAMQTLQVKLFSLDSRIENDRQAIGEKQKQLGEHMGRWRTDALQPPPHEQACDLN